MEAKDILNDVVPPTLTSTQDEFGELARYFNRFVSKIRDTVRQIGDTLQTLAAAAEEMSVSIKEIAKNTADAERVASAAVEITESTNAAVGRLGVNEYLMKPFTKAALHDKLVLVGVTS